MNMTIMIGTFTSSFRPLPRFGSRNAARFLLLLGAIFTAAVTPAAAQITPIFDSLQGPASPDLVIDFGKYGYTPAGLARTSSLSGFENGTDRPMNKTVATNFNSCNFVYELTVKTGTPNTDIIYVGFGQGTSDVGFFNEPTEAFQFRIHNNLVSNRIDAAVRTGGSFTSFATIGTYIPAGTTFQIVCAGSFVTLSVVGQPGSATFALGAVPTLTAENSRLFFGNTAEGTTFSDFLVESLLPTNVDQCKNGGWRAFGVFKNQGDCVSFVATGGKNPPAR